MTPAPPPDSSSPKPSPCQPESPRGPAPGSPRRKAVILGAGVAGLTAAHELMERGYEVEVYERAAWPGGKAATQYPWVNLDGQLRQVPAEHGFRLFPSFYHHLTDTLGRIPFPRYSQAALGRRLPMGNTPSQPGRLGRYYDTVAENLIPTLAASTARKGYEPQIIPRAYGDKLGDFLRAMDEFSSTLRIRDTHESDSQRFQVKCLQFLTSCSKRRDTVREHSYGGLTWHEFLGSEWFSPTFQREVDTFVRTMVAMNAQTGNARTVGNVGMQLIFDIATDGTKVDRVLNGPSSDQWLLPWEAYLRAGCVKFHYGHGVQRLVYNRATRRIVGVEYFDGSDVHTREIDDTTHVVAALPLEVMQRILSRRTAEHLVKEDPGLRWIRSVDILKFTSWMTGIQFYLKHDVPIVPGHVYYPESPWKLSSVSQAQFWGPDFHRNYGNGEFRGILSVDVCDWQTTRGVHTEAARGRVAEECRSAEDVAKEVWAQLRDSLTHDGRSALPQEYLGFHLDDNIRFPDSDTAAKWGAPDAKGSRTKAFNTSPYFIHPAGSHLVRPEAKTSIRNLCLAGDYVRTVTDLATMEGANESARLAVNAILEADALDADRCKLFELREPSEFDYAKKVDEDLFNRGEPHMFEVMGLFEHFERGMPPTGAKSVLRAAASAIEGPRFFRAGLPNLISRLF